MAGLRAPHSPQKKSQSASVLGDDDNQGDADRGNKDVTRRTLEHALSDVDADHRASLRVGDALRQARELITSRGHGREALGGWPWGGAWDGGGVPDEQSSEEEEEEEEEGIDVSMISGGAVISGDADLMGSGEGRGVGRGDGELTELEKSWLENDQWVVEGVVDGGGGGQKKKGKGKKKA
jgi:hypothetical protein